MPVKYGGIEIGGGYRIDMSLPFIATAKVGRIPLQTSRFCREMLNQQVDIASCQT